MENDYTKIYTGSMVIIQVLITRLEEIGITPIIKDENESGRLAGFGGSIPFQQEVFVHNNELDKAITVVQTTLAEMETS